MAHPTPKKGRKIRRSFNGGIDIFKTAGVTPGLLRSFCFDREVRRKRGQNKRTCQPPPIYNYTTMRLCYMLYCWLLSLLLLADYSSALVVAPRRRSATASFRKRSCSSSSCQKIALRILDITATTRDDNDNAIPIVADQTPSSNHNKHKNSNSILWSAAAVASSSSITIGFWGHAGLAMASFWVVKLVYAVWINPKQRTAAASNNDEQQQPAAAGILNRCPWPFIFFHDIRQGFRDSPTWMVLTWVALWRLVKVVVRPTTGVAP